ncbi:MAG: Type II secretory pathway [Limnothrix sp. RL_2_0]|nr:Type II secretory pathway [Limnothrix sp. RL_2_0]
MKAQQQGLFFRQLGATVKSGISLGQGIRLSMGSLSRRDRPVWEGIALNLERGMGLREALQPVRSQFSTWAIAVLVMADQSGAIAIVCPELAEMMVEMAERRRLFQGLVLRLLRMIWSWTMVVFLLTGGAVASVHFWVVGFAVALGLTLFTYLAITWQPMGDRLRFVPPFKQLFKIQTLVHLGHLQLPLDCGISVGAAVEWMRRDFPDPALEQILHKVEPKIRRGISLHEAMHPYFSLMVLQIIHTGEEAGSLALSFGQIRQYYQRELRRKIQLLNLQIMFVSLISFAFFVMLVGAQVLNTTLENLPNN